MALLVEDYDESKVMSFCTVAPCNLAGMRGSCVVTDHVIAWPSAWQSNHQPLPQDVFLFGWALQYSTVCL